MTTDSRIEYEQYLQNKTLANNIRGFKVEAQDINPLLFTYQNDIVRWALRIGRTLLGENCGLGKGPQLMEWCKQVVSHTDRPVLMFAPPGVKYQFKSEAEKFGYDVQISDNEADIINGINVTNYERLMMKETISIDEWEKYQTDYADYQPDELRRNGESMQVERFRFNPSQFAGLALDEASILKHFNAKTRERLTRFAEIGGIMFRVCGTATPAPNDYDELLNYAEFLGIMAGFQARAMFFIQDGNTTNKYRLKDWARKDFWKWVASWAVMIQSPGDLGYDDTDFKLPNMSTHLHTITDDIATPGMLIAMPANGLAELSKLKRKSYEVRCQKAAEIVNASYEKFVVWCELNDESALLAKLIPDAVEVTGSQSDEWKEQKLIGFARGEFRVIITKPKIGGLGLNWQICRNSVTVNIDHSYEKMYQYIRRIWRFGQEREVNVHMIAMSTEGSILSTIDRKEKQAAQMFKEIKQEMNIQDINQDGVSTEISQYKTGEASGNNWQLQLGDSCQLVHDLPDQSIHKIITSVPFPAMYAYTDLPQDIGNHFDASTIVEHLKYVFEPMLAKMMPGRICSIHVAQMISQKNRDGAIGLKDWIGPLIAMMSSAGWIYHNHITIEKDPQTERARNNTLGLMFKTLANDAANMRCANADYVVQFRAPGVNPEPIKALLAKKQTGNKYDSGGWITQEMWINWASNVWYRHRKGMKWWEGITTGNVLGSRHGYSQGMGDGVSDARDEKDEKHLCELQLDVIERCVGVWTNPGDTILDPFNGIGSTGWQALRMGRRYIGFELKDTYFDAAIKNLKQAESAMLQPSLLDALDEPVTPERKAKDWMVERNVHIGDERTEWEEIRDY